MNKVKKYGLIVIRAVAVALFYVIVFTLIAIALLSLYGAIVVLPFTLLWNWLLPVLFGLPTITFWQGYGIMFLLGIVALVFRSPTNKEK